ncbi:MAG: hypothetical protein ABR516_03385 [Desulfuromonadaceae bacterium]|nr:hypothetical protein [Geobacteraceae bacterium]
MRILFFAAVLLALFGHNAMGQQQTARGSDILRDMKNAMGEVGRDQIQLKTEKRLSGSAGTESENMRDHDSSQKDRRYDGAYNGLDESQREERERREERSEYAREEQREFERENANGFGKSRGNGNERARESSSFGRDRASEARGRK